MQYTSSNIFQDFEFHDAYFTYDNFDGNTLSLFAECLNIHKFTEQNPGDQDLELKLAKITFTGFQLQSFEPGRTWKENEKGEVQPAEPQVVFQGLPAMKLFLSELRHGMTVYEFGPLEQGDCYLDGSGEEPWYHIQFVFDAAMIEWDAYKKIAWYEEL